MVANFDFLRSIDKDLFEIINDAERLYRGEFFEQCIGQTRRFGEHICRRVLGNNRTNEVTFDEMLATLKDKIQGSEQEKEFIDDLYFLKKQGNNSVHSGKVKQDGITALECLQRSFEAAINYGVYYCKAKSDILKLRYDTELLVTGNKSKKSLSESYLEAKEKAIKKSSKTKKITKPKKSKQVTSMKSVPQKSGIPLFWILVGISFFMSFCAILFLVL